MIEKLLKSGYKEYNSGIFDYRLFQKRFADLTGIKYYIEAKYWASFDNARTGCIFSIQTESPKGTVSLETVQWFNNGCETATIEDVEIYFEEFWKFNNCLYVEKFNEEIP